MKLLSKYFLICIDPIIAGMDDDLDYDFSDDYDPDEAVYVESDETVCAESDEVVYVEPEEIVCAESDETVYVEPEEAVYYEPEDPNTPDCIEDVSDEIYAHKPIPDEDIIAGILENRLFAYSTTDNRRVGLNNSDWATIAKLTNIGMDRIFIDGKEVFVSGFNKISLKTEKNINIAVSQLRSRGLHESAEKIELLRC